MGILREFFLCYIDRNVISCFLAVEKNIRMKGVVAFLMVCFIMVVAGQDHLLRQSRSTLDEAKGGNDGWMTRLGRTNDEEGGNDGWQTRLGRTNNEAEGGNDGWQTRLGRTNNEEGGNDGWQTRLGRTNNEGNGD